jgi:hypothetical protein
MHMERDYERFRGGPNEAASKRVHITISPANLILLNRNIYERIGKPEAVYLYFSRERDSIGIEPTSPRFNEAFPVMPNGRGWRINAAPFCRHFNIRINQTLKFIAPQIVGRELRLKLSDTVSVAARKRKKQA